MDLTAASLRSSWNPETSCVSVEQKGVSIEFLTPEEARDFAATLIHCADHATGTGTTR